MNMPMIQQPVGPEWALEVLACSHCKARLKASGRLLYCPQCGDVGRWEGGIVRFGVPESDSSIVWYKSVGGTFFHERIQIPFTMSSLDTPVYHEYLEALKPDATTAVIADIGAGDGRNTEPWLTWGYHRVIATDAVFSSLARFRDRLEADHPEWLANLLLVECDMRSLPIVSGAAGLVLAVEALCYLNEDYQVGLGECARILRNGCQMMVSDRSWEGGLLTRLIYGGVKPMLDIAETRDLLDGDEASLVRSRTFTEEELASAVEAAGLLIRERKGVSVLSVVCGYLRDRGLVSVGDLRHFERLCQLLRDVGRAGTMRRTHVIVANKPVASSPPPEQRMGEP